MHQVQAAVEGVGSFGQLVPGVAFVVFFFVYVYVCALLRVCEVERLQTRVFAAAADVL